MEGDFAGRAGVALGAWVAGLAFGDAEGEANGSPVEGGGDGGVVAGVEGVGGFDFKETEKQMPDIFLSRKATTPQSSASFQLAPTLKRQSRPFPSPPAPPPAAAARP